MIGLGVAWGRTLIVLPFANDASGRCWDRLAELETQRALDSVGWIHLRRLMVDDRFARRIDAAMKFKTEGYPTK